MLGSFQILKGTKVTVERRVEVGRDPGNNPIFEWQSEDVENVLVVPGPRADVETSARPYGTHVTFNLHFPKGYPATLRHARIRVRGGDPLDVIGDPQHYMEENTPGPWSMPVEVGRVDG